MRKRVFLAACVLLVAGLAYFLRVGDTGRIGTGYAAEQTCACLFISHRALESCRLDLEPLAQRLVTIEPGDGEVTARSFGVVATARYDQRFGCSLQK